MPYVQIDDTSIFYNDSGDGEPVIFLHNGFYSSATWDGVRAMFAEHFRVIDYDRNGYGKSTHFEGTAIEGDIVEKSVQELEAFTEALHLARFSLVGHCLGGAVAMLFAARHPNRVRRIVASAVGYYGSARSLLQTDMTFVPFERIEPRLIKTMSTMHGEPYVQKLWSILSAHHSSYIMSETYDIRSEVRRVRCPALLVNGDRDFYFDVGHPVPIYKKLRRTAALWIVPNCGHDVHVDRPADFVSNVIAFLTARP